MSAIQDAVKQILDKPNDVPLRETFKRYLKLHDFIAMPPNLATVEIIEHTITQAYIELVKLADKLDLAEQVDWERPSAIREAMAQLEQQSDVKYTEDTFIFETLQHLSVLSATIRSQEQYGALSIVETLNAIDAIETLQISLEVEGLGFNLHKEILQRLNNTEVEQ